MKQPPCPSGLLGTDHLTPLTPLTAVEALQTLINEVDSFISHRCHRLEQPLDHAVPATADTVLDDKQKAFEQERCEWASRRQQDERRNQEKCEQLTQAWLHLEAEQRRFLQTKDAANHAIPMAASPTIPDSLNGSIVQRIPAANQSPSPSDASPACPAQPSAPTRINDQAIRQFQKMRKEIQSNRGF